MITTAFGLLVAIPVLVTASVIGLSWLSWWRSGWPLARDGLIGSILIDACARVTIGLFILWAVMR